MPRTTARNRTENVNIQQDGKVQNNLGIVAEPRRSARRTRSYLQNITNSKEINTTESLRRSTRKMGSTTGTDEVDKTTKQLQREEPIKSATIEEKGEDTSPEKKARLEEDTTAKNGTVADESEGKSTPAEKSESDAAGDDESVSPGSSVKHASKTTRMSLKGPSSSTPLKPVRSALPQQLLTVLSNLYLNATRRLQLQYPPRCAEDLAYCHEHHYLKARPELPTQVQQQTLLLALQQERIISFLDLVIDMCYRGVFPGGSIFKHLIELLLSINAREPHDVLLQRSCHKAIELFTLIVHTFPPCWREMRPFYSEFFQATLDTTKLSKAKYITLTKSHKVFDIVLDLLENTLNECTPEQLQGKHEEPISLESKEEATTATSGETLVKTNKEAEEETKTDKEQATEANKEQSTAESDASFGAQAVTESNQTCSEIINQWEWEKREKRLQSFEALPLTVRLERLFTVLRLLLQMLEHDLVMWLPHHHKKTKEWIFCTDNRPLVVQVFDLSLHQRCTPVVRRFFQLFALAIRKELQLERLQILERYVAVLMVASNTADMENTVIGVKYPYLGVETKNLIREFFKIFKANNTTKISTYIDTIAVLRIPYVKYEFIDNFLQIFGFARGDDMRPKKIAYDMAKKHWLKHQTAAELLEKSSHDEDLSREAYLDLLLKALQAYCDWHGLKQFFELFTEQREVKKFRATTDSVHRWPTQGNSSGVLVLKRMEGDIDELMQKLKLTVRMSRPKLDLPLADICIDEEIITKYRDDLKYLMILHNMLPQQATAHGNAVELSAWQTLLQHFEPQASDEE